jgi:hypothetical protein
LVCWFCFLLSLSCRREVEASRDVIFWTLGEKGEAFDFGARSFLLVCVVFYISRFRSSPFLPFVLKDVVGIKAWIWDMGYGKWKMLVDEIGTRHEKYDEMWQ